MEQKKINLKEVLLTAIVLICLSLILLELGTNISDALEFFPATK